MAHFQYLIIGGGLAGDAATRGIRELDPEGSIGMLSQEPDPPYMRPNLSKGLWKGRPMEKIWRNTGERNVDMHLGRTVVSLDPDKKSVRDDQGNEYSYDKLLIATGGTPTHLPFGGDNIMYYRDLQDYLELRKWTETGNRFLVIGGGFIGSEIAAALTMVGQQVVMVFPEEAIGAMVFPSDLAHYLNEYYREKGVEVVPSDLVEDVQKEGERFKVRTKNGRSFEVDGVVAGIGIRPNVELAKEAGLEVDDGIVVSERLETTTPDIYAAGDVANFYHVGLGERTRVEHEDNAVSMGKIAGINMAGGNEIYDHTPMFYSDLFEHGYEAVGKLDSSLETVEDWQEPFQKGTIYYLKDGQLRGVLLWNFWKQVNNARALLNEAGPFKEEDLVGRLEAS